MCIDARGPALTHGGLQRGRWPACTSENATESATSTASGACQRAKLGAELSELHDGISPANISSASPAIVGTNPSTTNAGRKHNASGPAMRTPAFSATACAASCA